MATVASRPAPKPRRGGRRILIVLAVLVLVVAGILVWLNVAAQAQVDASGMLTVYLPNATLAHGSGAASAATTGAIMRAGDTVATDTKGRAGITLPDGTLTRLASATTVTFDSAHFTKSGNLHDVSLTQQVGRTFTNVQHLVTGTNFDVKGKAATASVRGTKFEVLILPDGTMTVKVFQGTVTLHNSTGSVTINAGQQATASADGTLSQPIPIIPDPNDPFGPALDASNAVAANTTPGTEQDFIGAPLHNGEQQQYTYSYAGGNLVKAALGYPGSAMKLTVRAPDGQQYFAAGAIINGSGTYNGVGWSGSVVLVAHNGVFDIMPTGGSVFGMNVPAQQVVTQIAAAIGQDPSNVSPGFMVDRLFTCNSVMMVDGRA